MPAAKTQTDLLAVTIIEFAKLPAAHAKLVQMMSDHDDTALYRGPMKGANNNWTTGRWAEAAGPSHYRSAAKFVRTCKRAA